MARSIFRNNRHLWIMLVCCLIPAAALAAIFAFRIPASQVLTFSLVLLCPLSHFLLMGLMGRQRHTHSEAAQTGVRLSTGADNPQSPKQEEVACH